MTRIRSIKPEFYSSPGIETLEPFARILYIAMWNWADDNGVGTANPRELLGFAFPLDEDLTVVDLRRMLDGIHRVFGVKFYTVAGRAYYAIPSWEKHQKFDRRSKGKHPGPDEADNAPDQDKQAPSTESHESPSSTRRDSVAGTGEQGNRGTDTNAQPTVAREPSRFPDWWNIWEKKKAKGDAEKAYKASVPKKISHDDLMAKTTAYWDHVKRSGTDLQYVPYPATWLRAEQWDDDLDPTQAPRLDPMKDW